MAQLGSALALGARGPRFESERPDYRINYEVRPSRSAGNTRLQMTTVWDSRQPSAADRDSFADSMLGSFWLDDLPSRTPQPPLHGSTTADLCIVGGGYTGLWAALQAKADNPDRDVLLVEAATAGFGASGRNGGFLEQSLTHGIANGINHFPDEIDRIERLARESFAGLVADISSYSIDCDLDLCGAINVATEAHQVEGLREEAEHQRRFGLAVELFDNPEAIQQQVASPLFLAGVWSKDGAGTIHPGKLAEGLLNAALAAGVRVHENTRALKLLPTTTGVCVQVEGGEVEARRAVIATSAYRPLVREVRRYVAPVYDYVLVTEPLSDEQLDSLGWAGRQGISDSANRFHYYRLTPDNRILWGGYEAVYRYGGSVGGKHDDDPEVFAALARNFFLNFPQLNGLRFTHRWGGAIDTCSRFSVFFGTACGGRAAYAAGYTGLGVGATRFGARVALDLADGRATEATGLEMVRKKPVPFPPEPLRSAVIQLTRNRIAAADANGGQRGLWLRTLDGLGLGFDS